MENEVRRLADHETVFFSLNGLFFEYDAAKNRTNIRKHGVSFRTAARVFFDYDRIELYDDENSRDEDRYDVIGDASAGIPDTQESAIIGNLDRFAPGAEDILYVVYTERSSRVIDSRSETVIRLISARLATNFERGLYYGKQG